MKKTSYAKEWLVGGNPWRLKFVRLIDGDENTVGLCCPDTKEILLKQKQDYMQTFKTFIHEVVHAVEFEGEFELDHEHVEKMEEGLATFLVNNFEDLQRILGQFNKVLKRN